MAMIRSALKKTMSNSIAAASSSRFGRWPMATTTMDTKTKEDLEGAISTYYGQKASSNYAQMCGDNRHFGYFPHMKDPTKPVLNFTESLSALTLHMAEIAGINETSRVIDFGCGAGQPLFEICQTTGCEGLGLDLTPEHVELAKEKYASQCDKLDYVVGSVTDLPPEIKAGPKFTHVFSTQVFCHMARFQKDVFREAHSVLDTNGILVIDDFVQSESGVGKDAEDYFFKRLHFEPLQTFAGYAQGLTDAGFDIVSFENATDSMAYAYEIGSKRAAENECIEYDGQPLSKHYEETSKACKRGEIGMVVIVARKK